MRRSLLWSKEAALLAAKDSDPIIVGANIPIDPAMLRNAKDELPNVSTEDSEEVSVKGINATNFGNEWDWEILKTEGLN